MIESSHTLKKLKEDVPSWWRQFENGTDDTKNRIKDHIFLYLKMWDPTSGYSIRVNPKNLGSTILNDPTEGGVNIHDYSGMYKIFKRWSRWQRWNSFCYSTIVSSTWQNALKSHDLKAFAYFFHSKRGDRISELKGCIGEMSHQQQREILVEGKNDYSVQYSTSKRKYHLWLGPAAFLNHGNS